MEKYYDQETLLKVQKVQSCILKDVINVCLKYEIDIFMVFGSALGVVRHQGLFLGMTILILVFSGRLCQICASYPKGTRG